MQLRKLAAAMLVMGLTAGAAHAEDAASTAGQSTLDKIAKTALSSSVTVNHPFRSLTMTTNSRSSATLRTTRTRSLMPLRRS